MHDMLYLSSLPWHALQRSLAAISGIEGAQVPPPRFAMPAASPAAVDGNWLARARQNLQLTAGGRQ